MEDIWLEMLKSGMAPQIAGPGTDRYGDAEEMTTGEQAKQANLFQDWLKILMDPSLGVLGATTGRGGGFDYNQAFNTGATDGKTIVAPVRSTFSLDALQGDPNGQIVAEMIQAGKSLPEINDVIRNGDLSDELVADLLSEASTARKEWDDFRRATSQYEAEVAAQPQAMSPVNRMLSEASLPTLDQQYDVEYFSPQLAGLTEQTAITGAERKRTQQALQQALRRMAAGDSQQQAGGQALSGQAADDAEYAQQAPVTQAWWNLQDGVRRIVDGIGGAVRTGAVGLDGGAIPNLFRKPSGGQGGGVQHDADALSRSNRGRDAARSQGQAANVGPPLSKAAVEALRNQFRAARTANITSMEAESNARNYAAGAAQATKGRNPTSDEMMKRMVAARAFGLG